MQRQLNPQTILEALLRRKWVLIVPLVIGILCSVLLSRTLPKFYRSRCVILVHPSEISPDFARSAVEFNIRRELQNIEEQLLSRSWVERTVRELDLLSGVIEGPEFDGFVQDLVRRVSVETRSRTSFILSVHGKDPEEVYNVLTHLSQLFISETTEQAAKTESDAAHFLEDELRTVETELATKEERLAAYKQRYMGELPEQLDSNQRMLEQLQMQLQLNGENLRDARIRRLALEGQLSGMGGDMVGGLADPLMNELIEARRELERLSAQYTERHPDVINAVARVERAQEALSARADDKVITDDVNGGDVSSYSVSVQNELTNVKMNIQHFQEEELRLKQGIEDYESRVEAAFNRQQELTQLTRDYENHQEYFRSLMDRKLNTRLSRKVLRTHTANMYEVVDPAKLPRFPYRPDPIRVILFGIAGGLAVGLCLIFLLEFIGDRFFSPDFVEQSVGIPVLAVIPRLVTDHERRRRKIRRGMIVLALVLVVLSVLMADRYVIDLDEALREGLNRYIH